MATYLIHQSELKIIQEALAEYQSNYCGTKCPNASKCTDLNFCFEMSRDIALGSIKRIEFYENNQVAKNYNAFDTAIPSCNRYTGVGYQL